MTHAKIDYNSLSHEQITQLVFMLDAEHTVAPTRADCIFVFGSKSTGRERVKKAVELYQQHYADFLLFSGGTRWGKHMPAEALQMKAMAMHMGVPSSNIWTEVDSNHTKENVLASLLVLDRQIGLHHIRKLLVVSVPWHAKRCILTLKTYMPDWIEWIWCPTDMSPYMIENWSAEENIKHKVRKEAASIIRLVEEGQLKAFHYLDFLKR